MPHAPASAEQPFDPHLPTALDDFLAAWKLDGMTQAIVMRNPNGSYERLAYEDLEQLRARLAYAEKTRRELADKCATLRQERDELHARSDDVAAVLETGPRRNIDGRDYVRIDYVSLALEGHSTRAMPVTPTATNGDTPA